MFKKVQPLLCRILRFMALWCLAMPVYADIGIDWLASQAQPDGSYSTSTDLTMPFQATAETWRTFAQMGETATSQPSMTAALDFINAESFSSSEYLARVLVTRILTDQPVDALTSELSARFKYDGGGLVMQSIMTVL